MLGILVSYCTTQLYCDYARVISLHRVYVFLMRGVKILYSGQNHKYNYSSITFTNKVISKASHKVNALSRVINALHEFT